MPALQAVRPVRPRGRAGADAGSRREVALLAAVPPAPPALRAIAKLERRAPNVPLVWLGPRWRGLSLVDVERESGPFDASLFYADCTFEQVDTGSPKCHRVVELEEGPPEAGEISTQGGCTFSGRVRGATVALFRINPTTLRMFVRGGTVYISAGSRTRDLAAARALRGLNVRRLRPRPVSVGPCHAPPPRPPLHLTPKQRYERAMKGSFTIASASAVRFNASPQGAKALADSVHTFPLLLRNEALRIVRIQAPRAVAKLQRSLLVALRRYAADVTAGIALLRAGAAARADWPAREDALNRTFARDAGRILAVVREFRRAGYSVASTAGTH